MKRINHKSDFDLILRLKDCRGRDIGWPGFDWEARFWTWNKASSYTASRKGDALANCFEDGGRIHVVFAGHRLGPGTLKVELRAWLPDGIYPGGLRDVFDPRPLGIELVDGPGDCDCACVTVGEPSGGPAKERARMAWHVANGRRWGQYAHGMMPLNPHPGVVYKATKTYGLVERLSRELQVKARWKPTGPASGYVDIPGWMEALVIPEDGLAAMLRPNSESGTWIEAAVRRDGGRLVVEHPGWHEEEDYHGSVMLLIGTSFRSSYVMLTQKGELMSVNPEDVVFPPKRKTRLYTLTHNSLPFYLKDYEVERYAERRNWRRNLGNPEDEGPGAEYKYVSDWRKWDYEGSSQCPRLVRLRKSKKHEWACLKLGYNKDKELVSVCPSKNGAVKGRRVIKIDTATTHGGAGRTKKSNDMDSYAFRRQE